MGGIKMNENFDLTKILEGCPVGTEFYSSVFGNVRFVKINLFNTILMMTTTTYQSFAKDGRLYYGVGECTLFPSREQRDWSKFDRFWDKTKTEELLVETFDENTFQPFDKVLVRDFLSDNWMTDFFEKIEEHDIDYNVTCVTCKWAQCIPYNEETKHLLGTREDCPEYYKWWKE